MKRIPIANRGVRALARVWTPSPHQTARHAQRAAISSREEIA